MTILPFLHITYLLCMHRGSFYIFCHFHKDRIITSNLHLLCELVFSYRFYLLLSD